MLARLLQGRSSNILSCIQYSCGQQEEFFFHVHISIVIWHLRKNIVADSLESANSSILAARRHFKEVVGKKSGFYDNKVANQLI